MVLAATFVGLGQVHGIDWMFGGAMLAGALVVAMVGAYGVRAWVRTRRLVGAVAGAWIVVSVGFGGGLSGAAKVGDLPTVADGVDPTFDVLRPDPHVAAGRAPDWVAVHPELDRDESRRASAGPASRRSACSRSVGLVDARSGVRPAWCSSRRGGRSLFLAVVAVVVLAICSFFVLGWETFVPRRTGFGRLLQLYPGVIAVAVGVARGLVAPRAGATGGSRLGGVPVMPASSVFLA